MRICHKVTPFLSDFCHRTRIFTVQTCLSAHETPKIKSAARKNQMNADSVHLRKIFIFPALLDLKSVLWHGA